MRGALATVLALGALTFSSAAQVTAPTAVTGAATEVTATSAMVSVTVTRNGAATAAGVEYGTDTNYGSSVGVIDNPASTEGGYTVQVVLGGLTANTLYHYRAVASNSAGTAFGEDRTFFAGNNSPVAQDDEFTLSPGAGPFPLPVLANDSDPEGNPLRITAVTQPAGGTVTITNNGADLSYLVTDLNRIGDDSFTYVVSDGSSTASAAVTIHLPRRAPEVTVLFAKGDPVPGAGASGSHVPQGATFERFGFPSISDAGGVAFRAQTFSEEGTHIVLIAPTSEESAALLIKTGDAAPAADGGVTGLTFANLKHPLLNNRNEIAFLAKVAGSDVTGSSDEGIWTNEGGLLRMIAREGDIAPGVPGAGAVFEDFISVAFGHGGAILEEESTLPAVVAFVAQLENGRGGVTSANDVGLWVHRRGASESALRLLLREGTILDLQPEDAFPGRTVLSFLALQPLAAASGHGHGVGFNRHGRATEEVLALVRFTDATQAIVEFQIGTDVSVRRLAETGQSTFSDLTFKSLGMPTQSGDGQNGFLAKFQSDPEKEIDAETNSALYVANDLDTPNAFRIISEGAPLPGSGELFFDRFQNVVNDAGGNYAFLATVNGAGVTAANDTGIWAHIDGNSSLLAREGAPAAGAGEATFRSFVSLAMTGDGRALFKARIRDQSTPARAYGIWFTDSDNLLRFLLREGESIPGSDRGPVRTLSFLEYVPGSQAQARSYNNVGQVILRAIFADNSQAIVKAVLP